MGSIVYVVDCRWAKLQTLESDPAELTLRERLGDVLMNIRYTQMELSEFSNGPVAVIRLKLNNFVSVPNRPQVTVYQLYLVTRMSCLRITFSHWKRQCKFIDTSLIQ